MVGPYNNPQETYNYFSLPFCHPPGNRGHRWGGLGEVLDGNELIDSLLDINFGKNVHRASICELELDASKARQFNDATENSYWFEFFIGNLMICLCGVLRESFNLIKMIILVNLTQDNPKAIEDGRVYNMLTSRRRVHILLYRCWSYSLCHIILWLYWSFSKEWVLSDYSFWSTFTNDQYALFIVLLILVELGCAAFIFFYHDWDDVLPTDKTGNFDMIYDYMRHHWDIAK